MSQSNKNTMPRVAAVHDMSGYGKCSLTVALPVISACGVEVCPLPTALFSTNTQFEGFRMTDFTPYMDDYIAHWKAVGLRLDAVYSGFLGSEGQIALVAGLARDFAPHWTVVDPVMGDNGQIYATYTPGMCEGMKKLAACADIVTPNLTEGAALTGTRYAGTGGSPKEIERLAGRIAALGAKNVVVTGVLRGGRLYNCVLNDFGEYCEREISLLPFNMHGTGELFTSVLCGGLLTGHTLIESVDSAALFVYRAMEYSESIEDAHERGVCFEPLLHTLAGGICR